MIKLPWDADCDATRAGMERFLRALVCTGSHFTDSFALTAVDVPSRATIFFRIFVPEGREQYFMRLAKVDELRPPPRVHVGFDTDPGNGRVALRRAP